MIHQIRRAQISDASEIARLSNSLGYPAECEEITNRLELLLSNAFHFVVVAQSPDAAGLVGWLAAERRITLESGIKFEIVGLVVDEIKRRSGVGRALVQAVERWVLVQDGTNIVVRSNILRLESHGFYESLGYIRKKSQHVYGKRLSV
jgi:GNAT superfamily N-acetyltransferase